MTKTHIASLHLLLMVVTFQALFAQKTSDWEYKGEKDGIKIYHQKTPGLLHIKLATSVKAPLSGIALLFSDVDNYHLWGYKISQSRLLQRDSPTEVWYYAKYDFPWPLDDRDIILHSKMSQNPATRSISITNTPYPAYLPAKKGVVRIKNTTTRWLFVPGESGQVSVEQQISTDSAESMPDWLVKMTADTGPRETAKAVRKILQQEKYQTARLAHIRE
ncbi:MAG: START domain-containing protein [Saprospiraceae bacterium]